MTSEDRERLRGLLMELMLCGERFTDDEWYQACARHETREWAAPDNPCRYFFNEVFATSPRLARPTGEGSYVTEAGKKFVQSQ